MCPAAVYLSVFLTQGWLAMADFQLVKKFFFDKLNAVFQNLKSSEKPVIANERHP